MDGNRRLYSRGLVQCCRAQRFRLHDVQEEKRSLLLVSHHLKLGRPTSFSWLRVQILQHNYHRSNHKHNHYPWMVVDGDWAVAGSVLEITSGCQGAKNRARSLTHDCLERHYLAYSNHRPYFWFQMGLAHAKGIHVHGEDTDDHLLPARIHHLWYISLGHSPLIATCLSPADSFCDDADYLDQCSYHTHGPSSPWIRICRPVRD